MMQTVARETITIHDIVDRVLAYAEQYGENPLDLGLTLHVDMENWWIAMEMDAPYDWPEGTEVVEWAEDRYHDAGEAFDESLEARYLRQHTPPWDELKAEYDALLDGLRICFAWPSLSEKARVSRLTEIHHRLARLWTQIEQCRALDNNIWRRSIAATHHNH
jgi:hypothetical protein